MAQFKDWRSNRGEGSRLAFFRPRMRMGWLVSLFAFGKRNNPASSAFALAVNITLLTLGGDFKSCCGLQALRYRQSLRSATGLEPVTR
jgi:hypothetical protein